MKKVFLRSIAIALILTGAVAFLVWYWTMKREVPEHARVIPSDAFAVLTLNLRELASDRSGDEHLFPEMADESMIQKELEPFTRAILANGSTGTDEMSDILMFTYHSGEAAFFGIVVQLDDSAEFGNLMRVHVKKEFNIVPWTNDGIPIMRFDTTAAAIGWTEDVALFLYPLGNHGIATVSTQCIKLLKQQKENSVLANENFCDMELNSFAMSLWVQTKPFLNFTGGGELVEQVTDNIQYFNYLADFQDGEILVRSEWHLQDDVVKDNIKEFAFPCEPELMTSFIRTHFDVQNDITYDRYIGASALEKLPLSEEDTKKLIPFLTGDCIMIGHADIKPRLPLPIDSPLVYQSPGISTQSFSFHLAVADKAEELISSCMERDSIPLTARGWEYDVWGQKGWRMIVEDDLLTITNHEAVDGRPHAVTGKLAGYMAWFDLQTIFSSPGFGLTDSFIPGLFRGSPFLSDHLVTCTSTLPVQFRNVRRSEIKITFRNKEVNGLVQAEELVRKIYFTK